uniref:C2 NT-type domain-containing protein n=1 Tax=Oryza nivara TaxID=4536 RepID=A0A0E0IW11_ORYNI
MSTELDRRGSSDRLRERVKFRFSGFRAVQVPVVSDRLMLSIVAVDTGKTIAKSTKAAALSGACQWPDSILESIWFSQDQVSEEFQECQCRFVVSMGSTNSGILGEVFLNLTNYLSSLESTAISLPLKRCDSGTILQLNIQCLGAKSKTSRTNDDTECTSDGFDSMLNRTTHSLSGNDLGGSYQDEAGNRDASLSASRSYSGDSTTDRTNMPPNDNLNDELNTQRHNFASPDAIHVSADHVDEASRSNNSSFSSQTPSRNMLQGNNAQPSASDLSQLSSGVSHASKDVLENAEETIDELRGEAKMWQRKTRKLKQGLETLKKVSTDKSKQRSEQDLEKMWQRKTRKLKQGLETLKKECADKSKQQSELELELSISISERDSLRQEIEELKRSLEEVTACQTISRSPRSGDAIELQKEVEDDVQFLKESNASLATQLNKAQEANIELVSILQELEETIEVQRAEISNLSHTSDLIHHEVSPNNLLIQEDVEWARKVSLKEDEILMLREKIDRMLHVENPNGEGSGAIYLELEKENDFLKVKIQELEKDCSELTDENLELIYKLKEVSEVAKGEDPSVPNSEEVSSEGDLSDRLTSKVKYLETKCADLELKLISFRSESSELEEKLQKSQEELKDRILELSDLRDKLSGFHATEMEEGDIDSAKSYKLKSEKLDENDNKTELDALRSTVLLKEQEIESLQHSKKEMESFISEIMNEKNKLEELLEESLKECSIIAACLDEMREELLLLTSSIDSHVSTNNVLETKITELESCKVNLELHISKLEHENVELSEFISGLESQLTYLANEKERLSEVQEDSEALRRSNAKLQATVDHVVEECKSLQTLTADLKKQKLEVHGYASHLEQELEQSKRKTMDFCKTLESLEAKLSSLQEDISLKEQSLLSELENIFQEHKEHEERIDRVHLLLNKIEKEKTVELSNLEREVISLTAQLSSTEEERESSTLDTIREVSILRADKAKLEANLEDVNAQMIHYESQLEDLRESKTKIKDLVDSLNASKQNEEMLTTDVDNMRRSIEAARSNEDNLRKTLCELELKSKSSDYEKQQIIEEISVLKIQVHKIAGLQDEVLTLQSSLDEAKFEKGKLEGLIQSLSEECEELKAQKGMLTDKVSCMQDTLNAANEGKQIEISAQTKLVMLGDEPPVKETSDVLEAELKSELSIIRGANSEYQQKIYSLQKENEDLTRRNQLMEKELDLKTSQNKDENTNKQVSLQDEVLMLQSSLDEAKFENGKLEGLLQSLSEECEELKAQKGMLTDKVSCMQDTLNAANEGKQIEISAQTKLVMLGDEPPVKETSDVLEAELKSELSIIRGANSEYQQKIHSLQKENEDLTRRNQLMEKELDLKTSQNKDENTNKQGNDANENGDSPVNEVPELQSKIQLLETRLAEALEENKLYRGQLKSPIPEGKSASKDGKENDDDKISQLESELKDMQERLLNVSLQYAEVEAQREELVMELKTANAKKGRKNEINLAATNCKKLNNCKQVQN